MSNCSGDSAGSVFGFQHDDIGRKTKVEWKEDGGSPEDGIVIESFTYGDLIDKAQTLNLVNQLYEIRDQSGVSTIAVRDQRYNPVIKLQQLLADTTGESGKSVDGDQNLGDPLKVLFSFDLQGRLLSQTSRGQEGVEYSYNAAGLVSSGNRHLSGGDQDFNRLRCRL